MVHIALLAAQRYDAYHTFCRTVLNISMYQAHLPPIGLWYVKHLTYRFTMVQVISFIVRHGLLTATPFCLVSQFGSSSVEQYPISLCWPLIGYGLSMLYSGVTTAISYDSTVNILSTLCPVEGLPFSGEYYRLHMMWLMLLATCIIGRLYVFIVKLCGQRITRINDVCDTARKTQVEQQMLI